MLVIASTVVLSDSYQFPLSGNVISFANKVFADAISYDRAYWIRVGPKSNITSIFIKRGKSGYGDQDTQRTSGDDRGRDGSATAASQGVNTQGCQHLPEASRKEGFCPRAGTENRALPTAWFYISSFQNCEKINLFCFKLFSLWYFVSAAVGNSGIIEEWRMSNLFNKWD